MHYEMVPKHPLVKDFHIESGAGFRAHTPDDYPLAVGAFILMLLTAGVGAALMNMAVFTAQGLVPVASLAEPPKILIAAPPINKRSRFDLAPAAQAG